MDQYSLRLFLELAEDLHFGKASMRSNVSPSALSRTIRRLEEEVGQTLFLRDNRSVALTDAGLLYRDYAREVLNRWEQLKSSVEEEKKVLKGEIRIYCSVTACYSILPGILDSFRVQYPEVHIKLQTGDAASALKHVVENDVDVAITARPESLPRGIEYIRITSTPLYFIGPIVDCEVRRAVSSHSPVLENVPMILPDEGLARKRIDLWFRKQGITPMIYAEVSGNEAILAMVQVGCGVGVVPGLVIEKSPIKTAVKVLEVNPSLQPYIVGIAAQKRSLAVPAVSAFWETAGTLAS